MGLTQKEHVTPKFMKDYARKILVPMNKVSSLNCLEYVKTLPPKVLDCTITSPPTCFGKNDERTTLCNSSSSQTEFSWENHVVDQTNLLEELFRVTKQGGHLWYITDVEHEGTNCLHPVTWLIRTPWKVRQEIIWKEKTIPKAIPGRFMQKERRIYWLRKEPGPPFSLNSSVSRWGSIWFTPCKTESKRSNHSSTLPIYLVMAIIHAMNLRTGSLVFDPYGSSGTGSTAKACQVAGHHFLTTGKNRLYNRMIPDSLKQTSDEDIYWISLITKQISEEKLDLSQSWEIQE